MDFYQSIVTEYLQRDRGCFLNTEFYLVDRKPLEGQKKEWFVDIVAMELRYGRIWLCEVSYARNLSALVARLRVWSDRWAHVCDRVRYEACLTNEMQQWPIYVWAFVPPDSQKAIAKIRNLNFGKWRARISTLDRVAPWLDNRWPVSWTEKDREGSKLAQFPGPRV